MPDDEKEPGPSVPEMPMYEKTIHGGDMAAGYAGATTTLAQQEKVIDHTPTMSERLAMRKAHLEHELAQVNAAIEAALNASPTMRVLDTLTKAGLLR